ncbi:MAG TPA: glycosyltransferase [Moheibacter sp.]|nr:glycosyltransferase [Moheibacter sp.]
MKRICLLADRHSLYDDRGYWKISVSLKNNGFEVFMVIIGDKNGEGMTTEGIHFKCIKRKQYLGQRHFNYLLKKFLPIKTEYDEALEYCAKIKADIYQFEDLRLNRITKQLKNLPHKPKLVYDLREPRDNNLKDIQFKSSPLPKFLIDFYADSVQNWEYKMMKYFDFALAVDDGIYNRIRKNVPQIPVELIYNFTNLKSSRKNVPFEEKKYDAAYVGGVNKIRGGITAVKAAKIVSAQIPDFKLLLLGKIHEKDVRVEIEEFILKHELEKNIIIQDSVPYKEVPNYYNHIKIGLNPLFYAKAHLEIIQIKLFEYMNYGIPIITSNFGFMQKYVEENEVGLTVPPTDEKALAEAIISLLNNGDLYEKFSKNGIRAVDEKFNWDVMEEKLLKIYDSLLKNGASD